MKKYIIIVAGGKGLRMGTDLPKQFMLLAGRPVLMHTLDNFHTCLPDACIILVLPLAHQEYWRGLCRDFSFDVPHIIADGGETRFHSVRNGLAMVDYDVDSLVAVHDGVRPFVSHDVIKRCFNLAAQGKAVVPVTDVIETLRRIEGVNGNSVTVPRNSYKLVQTPQVFPVSMLKKAYEQAFIPDFTDDASVVESKGYQVTLAEGNRENIKLTTPFDIMIAEKLVVKLMS